MILAIGSGRDKVFPVLLERLRAAGAAFRALDEDAADRPVGIAREPDGADGTVFRLSGQGCEGRLPVRCVFVRHAVARTLDPAVTGPLGALQVAINLMLLEVSCPVVNPPSHAFSNYSKVHQLGLLAAAGFEVPETLLTNRPEAAAAFRPTRTEREIIFKGASNMMTLVQVLTAAKRARLAHLPESPTVFQERIPGTDLRVHVIGDTWIGTRLVSDDPDYRRAAFDDAPVRAEAAGLPDGLGERCVRATREMGLVASGIDFRVEPDGRHVVLELNPFPQFTFYERLGGQPIMDALVAELMRLAASCPASGSNLLA